MTDFTDDMRRRLDRQVGDTDDCTLIEVRSGDLRALLRHCEELCGADEQADELQEKLDGAEERIAQLEAAVAELERAEAAA